MPDLIFNTLSQLKTLPELQHKQFTELKAQQLANQKSTLYGMIGSTCFVIGVLLVFNALPIYYELVAFAVGGIFWFKALSKLIQKD